MGGITNGPTVIRQLKSVFPRNVKLQKGPTHLHTNIKPALNLHTDNFVFRIYTRLTPLMFLVLAGLIFWQRMSGEHINCYAPPDRADIRGQAVNQFCFVTGTYTVTGYPTDLNRISKRLPYPGVGPHVPPSKLNGGGTEVKYHLYFQWVPFVLLIQAVLLMLPRHLWKGILKDNLSRYCESIVHNDVRDNEQGPERIMPAARRFVKNSRSNNSSSRGFILCEILSLLLALAYLAISDKLLTGDFLSLGYDWLKFLLYGHTDSYHAALNTTDSPLDLIFPKMSKCEFKMFGPSGGIINYDILCVMTLNVLHDKVYLFQWFWLWLIIDLQLLNLIYRLVLRSWGSLRWSRIMARIEPAFVEDDSYHYEENDDTDKLSQFKEDAKQMVISLSYSDWFMLQAIATSLDPVKFTGFLQNLIYLYKEEKSRHASNENKKTSGGLKRTSGHYGDNMIMATKIRPNDKPEGSEVTSPLLSSQFPGPADDNGEHQHRRRRSGNLYTNLDLGVVMQDETVQVNERMGSANNLNSVHFHPSVLEDEADRESRPGSVVGVHNSR